MSNPLSNTFLQPVSPQSPNVSSPQGNLAELIKLQGPQLVRDHGEPLCPSQVTQYLQSIDERLFMRAFPFPSGWEWAMCETWGENDPRRITIRTGETPPDRAFDVLGYVPPQVKITSAEDAMHFLAASLRSNVRHRPDLQQYLNAIEDHNTRQAERNLAPVKEYAEELASANTQSMFAEQGKTVAKVFQSEPQNQSGTKRTKGRAADIPKPS